MNTLLLVPVLIHLAWVGVVVNIHYKSYIISSEINTSVAHSFN